MRNKKILFILLLALILILAYFVGKEVGDISNNQKIDKEKLALIKKEGLNLIDYGVKGDGKTDDTEKINAAIKDSVKKNKYLIIPAKKYLVSPTKYRKPSSSDGSCIIIPSNAKIYFETGSLFKLIDNAPQWTRVIVIDNVSNILLYGQLEVDGNAKTVKNGNEHMAGVFLYDVQNVYIESIYSHDCYGDNVFIGGLEDEYSDNVTISYIKGVTAGRKNLVIHYVDNLYIETAILDNSKGGVGGNWKGSNSLDLEPDDYEGKKEFYQKIDYLTTYGKGNDFTVGTEKQLAEKWILEIGSFNVFLMEGSTVGLLSYAITVKVNKLLIQSSETNNDQGMKLEYAANWEINEAYFINGKDYAISAREADGEKPNLKIGDIVIARTSGKGLELWGSDASITSMEANTVQGEVLNIYATNNQLIEIGQLISRNSSTTSIIKISDYGYNPIVKIEDLFISDNRSIQAKSILNLYTQKAVDGLEIDRFFNYDNLKKITYGPTVNNKKDF